MPTNRRQGAGTKPRGARSATATPLERRIQEEVTVGIKRRLGLGEGDTVPTSVQRLVKTAAHEVAESSIATSVLREVEAVAARLGRSSLDRKPEVDTSFSDKALLAEAEYLATKKKALQAAGFSSEESMRILVAEISAGRALGSDRSGLPRGHL